MSKRKKKYHGPKIVGQWVPHPVALIRVLRELSLTARRILDTLEIEHCRHGGRENGRLIATYDDLAHHAGFICGGCGTHRGWMSGATFNFLSTIIDTIGRPQEPIVVSTNSRASADVSATAPQTEQL